MTPRIQHACDHPLALASPRVSGRPALEVAAGEAHGRSVELREATVAELVIAAQRGDRRAFASLYERFHRVVHAVALARVAACDAGDVVQDVFADAWSKLARLREPAAFPGWIVASARNRASDAARRDRRRPGAQPERAVRSGVRTGTGGDLAVDPPPRVEAAAALRALRELPDTYRETMIMRLVEGLTGPEIAEHTGMSPDSVRVHLHRGMKLLRERLADRTVHGSDGDAAALPGRQGATRRGEL